MINMGYVKLCEMLFVYICLALTRIPKNIQERIENFFNLSEFEDLHIFDRNFLLKQKY